MPFDGFVTRAIVHELANTLIHTKIHKIYQPHQSDLVFYLRGRGETYHLVISANPTYPRIHLTDKTFINPVEPPMFCMLLRKHLEGGIIEAIQQKDLERIIHIDIQTRNEFGDTETKRLVVEIMGRHSNIILVQPEKNQILDGIHHVTSAISSYRQVLPGKTYKAPPEQNKKNPLSLNQEQFYLTIRFNEGKLDKQLVNSFTGMSPAIAKEILYQAKLPTRENLWYAFDHWMKKTKLHQYQPAIVTGQQKADFSIYPFTYLEGDVLSFATMNQCLEAFYEQKAERDTVRQKAHDLSRILQTEKNKNEKKIEHLLQDQKEAEKAEIFQLYGELITAHLHLIKRGDKEITVTNYYDEHQGEITIPLDPLKTPSENAQAFFRKYTKLKNSLDYIVRELKKTKEEIVYLDTILTQLENAGIQDIEDIREELTEQGYLKEKKKNGKKKTKRPQVELFVSSEGYPIYVGKNNRQNEYLTHRLASSQDTWMHTKEIPGSHVVIKAKEFGDQTLREAAMLAAYYSKAKHSSQVPVDYTLIKYVKKPNGAKPGFVIYDHQKTVYVTPDESLVKRLQTNRK